FRYLDSKANMLFEHKLKVYKKELEEKEKNIPINKKTEPDFHAVSMALDNSKFCITNDDLRKMFVNLIANTMNSDMKDIAHPAFSEIIKQMTSQDAIILRSFAIDHDQPIVEIIHIDKDKSYDIIQSNYFLLQGRRIICTAESSSISISNLIRLGLIKVDYGKTLNIPNIYEKYERILEEKFEGNSLEKGIVSLTQVGEAFIKACFE
ncbi:MAG: DUF4393 domain-containing protein, partial [Ruminococcus sp.]|nr:DUF4393 domain-containing protein [Ruminococcus sp.]